MVKINFFQFRAGFSLAVIRGIVEDELLARSLTAEDFNTPTAPGLGLMLERLHFTQYANVYASHDPLIFDDCDEAVEHFRQKHIHPIIVQTEINEKSMVNWLEYLCIHSFDAAAKEADEQRTHRMDIKYSDEWGEDKNFIEKLRKFKNDE